MRSFAESVITQAAVAAGLPAASVMAEPDKQSILLPKPRLEMAWLPEELTRAPKRLARLPRSTDGTSDTHCRMRWVVYARKLAGRLTLRAEDGDSLETLTLAVLLAMPALTADPDGNAVTITAVTAARGGFLSRLVEPLPERSCSIHVTFAGWLCRDVSRPWIKTVTFNDPPVKGVPHAGQ
jgi:hypothetical protein